MNKRTKNLLALISMIAIMLLIVELGAHTQKTKETLESIQPISRPNRQVQPDTPKDHRSVPAANSSAKSIAKTLPIVYNIAVR